MRGVRGESDRRRNHPVKLTTAAKGFVRLQWARATWDIADEAEQWRRWNEHCRGCPTMLVQVLTVEGVPLSDRLGAFCGSDAVDGVSCGCLLANAPRAASRAEAVPLMQPDGCLTVRSKKCVQGKW